MRLSTWSTSNADSSKKHKFGSFHPSLIFSSHRPYHWSWNPHTGKTPNFGDQKTDVWALPPSQASVSPFHAPRVDSTCCQRVLSALFRSFSSKWWTSRQGKRLAMVDCVMAYIF
ncbi:uncharacterized protein LOC108464599 [Gossypium arboreum]|uniref:uncharacterized protein LOC108464599 n=1 Tax=Gossypium arboreum TaxID=29729 RepID=UPI0022F17651|nr:uncharacterized protein LOC108464599 [Gossypium arboreum]